MFRFIALFLLAAVALVLGCDSLGLGSQTKTETVTVPDTSAQDENVRLKQQLAASESEKAGLKGELVASEGKISAAELEAREWRKKYDAAKESMPAGGEQVPPELMKAFIELARAGGPWEIGEGGTLKVGSDVLFDSGKADVKPAGESALKEIAPKLKEILADKRVVLAVEGHTDNDPIKHSGFKDNRHLSLMRAHAAVTFLATQGLPPAALRAVGMGEFHPIAVNDTKEGRAQNRRVELRLINANSAEAKTPPAAAGDATPK
jgi:chemotaxis protein MotB